MKGVPRHEAAGCAAGTCESFCVDVRLPRPGSSDSLCSECLLLETRAAFVGGTVLDLVVEDH